MTRAITGPQKLLSVASLLLLAPTADPGTITRQPSASAFARAPRDFTLHIYKDAGHTLKVSATGFNDEPSQPERFTAGHPEIMIQWLRTHRVIK
jgi:hypothetical protein